MEQSKRAQKQQEANDKGNSNEDIKNDASHGMPKEQITNMEKDETSKSKSLKKTDEKNAEKTEKDLDFEDLKQKLNEKITQVEEYQDRLLRTQAEFENFKKRTNKEQNEFKAYANAQLVKDILTILDDFQNALAAGKNDTDNEFLRGFEIIYNNLYEIMEKQGLCLINPENNKFDPWKHEAVETLQTDEYPEHTIIHVVQPGYMFKDKILRPAKVRVTISPKENEKNSIIEEEKQDSDSKKIDNND